MKTSTLLLLLTIPFWSPAQNWNVIASAGQTVSGNSHSICYTVGEAVISQASGTQYTALQGFQQPDWITVGIEELASYSKQEFEVYPNPSAGRIRLVNNSFIANSTFWLFDNQGRLVETLSLDGTQQFNLGQLPAGSYQLTTLDEATRTIYNASIILTR